MKNIHIRDLESNRLIMKKPTIEEQYKLWDILRDEKVNRYYFPTPDRIFNKYKLSKDNINDLKEARKIFLKQLNDWERQKPFYEQKIIDINNETNSQKYTWSLFLQNGEPIGQMTVQPTNEYPDNPEIRDVGWYIDPKYQRQGYCSEAAQEILRFMFEEVEIDRIITSAADINEGSWKLMEKFGFEYTGDKKSTYFDDNDNILMLKCYNCDREMFLNNNKHKKLTLKG